MAAFLYLAISYCWRVALVALLAAMSTVAAGQGGGMEGGGGQQRDAGKINTIIL